MKLRKRIAIFGGSFNPVHVGHIALARSVVQQQLADEVWLLVSPQNPLKQQADLLPEAQRLALARKALVNEDGVEVSDFEFHLPRPSYTWNTLQALSAAYPDVDFSLLIGADNWALFHRWAHPADILAHHQLWVYPRQGIVVDETSLPAGVCLIEAPLFPLSSTDIRNLVRKGESIHGYVPQAIEQDVQRLYATQ